MRHVRDFCGLAGFIGIFLGPLAFHLGWKEWYFLTRVGAEPQVISLAELLDHPQQDNLHVTITNFRWAKFYFHAVGRNGEWQSPGWVVLHLPDPRDNLARLQVVSSQVSNAAEMAELASKDTVTGVLVSSESARNPKANEELVQRYPGTDPEKVLTLDERRPLPTVLGVLIRMGGGVLVTVVAIFGVLMYFWPGRVLKLFGWRSA
jgi:hypothetical protein